MKEDEYQVIVIDVGTKYITLRNIVDVFDMHEINVPALK